MKIKIALGLVALAFLPACASTWTAYDTAHSGAYFANDTPGQEPAPPAEGPADINANPAYIPTPLLRSSAAASP